MANSRSNIYPVQLQGAELNLNKFDAEIKQYSGFNKNNSPFVGGCLSNLFTKTEENTTGSSDSVYVDDNGDVYEAKTDGLYKNGEKVLGNGPYNALNIVEVDLPERVLCYDFNTVTKEEVFYYFNDRDVYSSSIKRCKRNSVTKEIIHDDVIHEVEDKSGSGYIYVKSYVSMIADAKYEVYEDVYYNPTTGKYLIEIEAYVYNTPWTASYHHIRQDFEVNKADYIDCPCLAHIYDEPYLIVVPNVIGANKVIYYYGGNFSLVTPVITNETGFSLASSNIGDYAVVALRGFLVKASGMTINNTAKKIALKSSLIIKNSGSDVSIVFNFAYASQDLKYTTPATVDFSIGTFENKYVFSKDCVCYGLKTSDNKNFWGISNTYGPDITQTVTLREDSNGNKHPMLEMGCLASYNVLANNGHVSGITSSNGVLLSEWNSVNKDYIFSSVDGLLFRHETSKRYYKILENSDVKIKYINGLLVINWDAPENCYRISDKKILCFAPAWNNRAPQDNSFTFDAAVTDNEYYMASSVNEYNLRDNASILLNPVPVITNVLAVVGNTKITDVSLENADIIYNNRYRYNFYVGSDSEVLYKGTFGGVKGVFVSNGDLIGLPFPINTGGNVQLSPSLFCKTERFGNDVFIKEGSNAYQLIKDGAESVMSYYLGTLIENLEDIFILQGQYYAIIDKQIFNVQFSGGVVQSLSFVVSVENLQFCGNSAYQAYFFSKTNRCIYVFTGANILNQLQLVDKISEIYAYKYNQSTQSIILITDIGTIVSSNLGMYLIEGFTPDDVFFYDKGVVFVSDSELTYLQYYEADGFEKHNIEVETCFYGMNNETVTINDCLYFRLFSEEHEEGEVKVSATTISLKGRKTETTVFKFKASDWDALTHSVYVRYQPKEQRGLGISFSINSPFKIASLSVGSKADAILVDKVSKGAVITPSNNDEW